MSGVATEFRTAEAAIEAAHALAPRLRNRIEEAEALRRLPDETVADLAESGLLRLLVPPMWDGPALNLDTLLEVTGIIAESCSSTGWVYALWASHLWLIAQYPRDVQAEVFSDPGARVSSVVNTQGTIRKVEGGYVWSGRGFFCSGGDASTWLTAAVDIPGPAADETERHWLLIPRGDYTIIDDWNTVGLRGTGSNTVLLEDVFVPDERVITGRLLSDGRGSGALLHATPLYEASIDFTFGFPLAGAELGIARAAVNEFQQRSRQRVTPGSNRLGAEQAAALMCFAQASAEIEAAYTLLMADARHFCNMPARNATTMDRARCRRDVSFATQMCRRAVNSLFEASSTSDVRQRLNLQRLWRDSNVAGAHHGLMWDIHGLQYGRIAAGLDTALDPVGI